MATQNFLSTTSFGFKIARLPNVSFFVQNAVLPGVSIGFVNQPTPFKTLHLAGDKMEYDTFDITIRMDENLQAFAEIYRWMQGLSHPNSFEEYKKLKESDYGLYSDGTLLLYSSNQKPIINFTFKDMFPISMTGMNLDSTVETNVFVTTTITFKHNGFEFNYLNS